MCVCVSERAYICKITSSGLQVVPLFVCKFDMLAVCALPETILLPLINSFIALHTIVSFFSISFFFSFRSVGLSFAAAYRIIPNYCIFINYLRFHFFSLVIHGEILR